uniref:Uncharacterized protein n=1 Tax=Pyramimonas obovata TaxID=1411642 RepID=A0A7S0MXR4_9CHLO|mmetsp:Transcript_15958/g.34616  ORF Transcript_15958/g.34616 Transcript_15958/m.34616 type:complete len:426 (+) Transcript_15958:308-1585(+)
MAASVSPPSLSESDEGVRDAASRKSMLIDQALRSHKKLTFKEAVTLVVAANRFECEGEKRAVRRAAGAKSIPQKRADRMVQHLQKSKQGCTTFREAANLVIAANRFGAESNKSHHHKSLAEKRAERKIHILQGKKDALNTHRSAHDEESAKHVQEHAKHEHAHHAHHSIVDKRARRKMETLQRKCIIQNPTISAPTSPSRGGGGSTLSPARGMLFTRHSAVSAPTTPSRSARSSMEADVKDRHRSVTVISSASHPVAVVESSHYSLKAVKTNVASMSIKEEVSNDPSNPLAGSPVAWNSDGVVIPKLAVEEASAPRSLGRKSRMEEVTCETARSTDCSPRVEGPPVTHFSDVLTPRSRASQPTTPNPEEPPLRKEGAPALEGEWPARRSSEEEGMAARKEAVRMRNLKFGANKVEEEMFIPGTPH